MIADAVRSLVMFGLGAAILLVAVTDEEGVHWGAAVIALVLMGVVSIDQLHAVVERRVPPPSTPPPPATPPATAQGQSDML